MTPGDVVVDYYDRNTRRFLFVGRSRNRYAIHRELWGVGVRDVREALGHVNQLVAEAVRDAFPDSSPTLLDMGCGVGGTLFELADRLPRATLNGVTNSPRQHALARSFKGRMDPDDRCRFVLADFQTMRLGFRADVVFGIESFVHSDTPERFLSSARAHLEPGGRLVLVDDFLAREESTLTEGERAHVERFRRGWHARSVCTPEHCIDTARTLGLTLVEDRDLTGLVRLGRPRDRVIARLAPLFRRLGLIRRPFFANMIGGDALQSGLREGIIRYRMLVFQERDPR